MPNKQITDGNYRYNFQGQEKDPETGMEAFELRLWDGRLGRWLSVDPAGEFFSPYLGMGNNPVSETDPTGGSTEDCCPDPPVNGGIIPEVTITTIRTKINNAADYGLAFLAGGVSAFGSNLAWGSMRMDAEKDWSNANTRGGFRTGEFLGNIASIFAGEAEKTLGGLVAAGGIVLSPVGGISLSATVVGGGMVVHGQGVAITGAVHLAGDIKGIAINSANANHGGNGGGNGGNNLSKGGKKKIGNLIEYVSSKARDVLKLRGGNNSAINQGRSDYWDKSLGEIANKAAAGDEDAETIMKLVKQASSKAQKY